MIYLLQHSALFALLAVACWLAGVWLDHVLPLAPLRDDVSPDDADDPLRQLRRWSLGIGLWIACAFVLAASGLLGRFSVRAVLAGLAVAGTVAWLRNRRPATPFRARPVHVLLAGLGVLTLLPLYLLALTPTISWDASVYHLTLPKLFLAHGGFRPVAMNVYSHWPLNVELLFAVAMAVYDHVLAKLVHFGFGLLTLYAVWVGCRACHPGGVQTKHGHPGGVQTKHGRPASGWLAMPLLLANGVVVFEIRAAYVDLAYAFFFVAGFLFMVEALERRPRALWLAGICCGIVAGIKITGVAGAAVIGALYLPRLVRALRRRELTAALRPFLVRFALPVFVLWAPWPARAAWLTGNPFYPLFHDWLGGPDWSSALSARLQAWQSSIGMGRTPVDYLLLPVRIFLDGELGYERFDGELGAFWLVLIPLAIWTAIGVPPEGGQRNTVILVRRCLAAAGLYFVFWSLSAQQMRFLIPALPLLAIAGAVSLVELLDRLRTRWRRVGRAIAFAAAVGVLIAGQSRILGAGYRTLGRYLQVQGDLVSTAVHPVYRFVNDHLPPDALLLFLGTNQRFFCDREALADSFFEASQIAAWLAPATDVPELRRRLAVRGVSHLLVDRRLLADPRLPIGYPASLGELLQDPAQVDVLYRSPDGRFSVLELRDLAGAPADA